MRSLTKINNQHQYDLLFLIFYKLFISQQYNNDFAQYKLIKATSILRKNYKTKN